MKTITKKISLITLGLFAISGAALANTPINTAPATLYNTAQSSAASFTLEPIDNGGKGPVSITVGSQGKQNVNVPDGAYKLYASSITSTHASAGDYIYTGGTGTSGETIIFSPTSSFQAIFKGKTSSEFAPTTQH
jgi:hypothetical protein